MDIAPPALLAAVWREVSRHLDIEESALALFECLRPYASVEALVVRRFDPDRRQLVTVGRAGQADVTAPTRTSLGRDAAEALMAAAAAPRVFKTEGLATSWVEGGAPGSWWVAPLRDEGETACIGLLALNGAGVGLEGLVGALAEPVATAMQNDRRLHELARLREAADADRRALLTRLARQDVSDAIVGATTGLREVMERVEQVARTDVPALLLGETGSGKEVVARAIHAASLRSEAPFLRVNCGAIPSELIDSELFGHEKGAFTGAIAQRLGWFERADGGTLFLDEVGDLPPAAQVRLLRVLQDGSFQRVGGQETHVVDVRIVAATHRDMASMIQAGTFRQDLWYRVSVFPIALPALRERRGDIPLLATHLAERAGQRLFGKALVPTISDLALLSGYGWPGNVRELAAVIERAAILGDGRGLEVARSLGTAPVSGPFAPSYDGPPRTAVRSSHGWQTARAPEPAEDRDAILVAVERSRGRIEGPFGAAAVLGVNPHTLRARMRRLGIDWARIRRDLGGA